MSSFDATRLAVGDKVIIGRDTVASVIRVMVMQIIVQEVGGGPTRRFMRRGGYEVVGNSFLTAWSPEAEADISVRTEFRLAVNQIALTARA